MSVRVEVVLIAGYLLGQHRIFALRFHLERPLYVERYMFLVHFEKEDLAAALWWIQTLVLGSAFEESADVVGADPVSLTWCLEENVAAGFVAAADDAGSRHDVVGIRAELLYSSGVL